MDAFIETGNESEAYRRAYNAERMSARAITVEATRLMKHPAITLVLKQRQQELERRHAVTVDSVVQGLGDIANDPDAPAAAKVSALMGQARIMGFIVDRREVKGNVDVRKGPSELEIALAALPEEEHADYVRSLADNYTRRRNEHEALPMPNVIEGTFTEAADDA